MDYGHNSSEVPSHSAHIVTTAIWIAQRSDEVIFGSCSLLINLSEVRITCISTCKLILFSQATWKKYNSLIIRRLVAWMKLLLFDHRTYLTCENFYDSYAKSPNIMLLWWSASFEWFWRLVHHSSFNGVTGQSMYTYIPGFSQTRAIFTWHQTYLFCITTTYLSGCEHSLWRIAQWKQSVPSQLASQSCQKSSVRVKDKHMQCLYMNSSEKNHLIQNNVIHLQ